MDNILVMENFSQGINFSNIDDFLNNYRVSTAFGMLIFNIFFWLIWGIYLD
jgi:hypothetical protein